MTAAMVERVDSVLGLDSKAGREVRSAQGARSRFCGPGSLRVIDGGLAGQSVAGACEVSRPVSMEASVGAGVSEWRLTERGIAVVMGVLALLVVAGLLCVVATFLQVTS